MCQNSWKGKLQYFQQIAYPHPKVWMKMDSSSKWKWNINLTVIAKTKKFLEEHKSYFCECEFGNIFPDMTTKAQIDFFKV